MTTAYLNEVDLPTVGALVQSIQDDPNNAQTTWKSEVTWDGAFRTSARSRDFDPIAFDEPPGLGGTNTAPNPVEQLLGALGSCLVIGYAANASVAGIELKDLRIELEGDLDLKTFLGLGDGNAGFSTIGATVHIEAEADDAAIEALHRRVVSTSPVGHCLSRSIPLNVSLA
ncbi:MAG TPA: OsmC family protein [Acidimicrobiia bacterium]